MWVKDESSESKLFIIIDCLSQLRPDIRLPAALPLILRPRCVFFQPVQYSTHKNYTNIVGLDSVQSIADGAWQSLRLPDYTKHDAVTAAADPHFWDCVGPTNGIFHLGSQKKLKRLNSIFLFR